MPEIYIMLLTNTTSIKRKKKKKEKKPTPWNIIQSGAFISQEYSKHYFFVKWCKQV